MIDRDCLVKQIKAVFNINENKDAIELFLDMVEEDGVQGYDMINHNDEIYIIDREHYQYINWYKLTHIGRDLHTDIQTEKDLKEFLLRLRDAYFGNVKRC